MFAAFIPIYYYPPHPHSVHSVHSVSSCSSPDNLFDPTAIAILTVSIIVIAICLLIGLFTLPRD